MKPIIIDSIMGSGKTSWAIRYMNDTKQSGLMADRPVKWMYIGVTLDEVFRIKQACSYLNMQDPVETEGHKYKSFKQLIYEGHNIVSTHALFRFLDAEATLMLRNKGYQLIIDETLDCVEEYDGLSSKDRAMLEELDILKIDEQGHLRWNNDNPEYRSYASGRFADFKKLCDNGNLLAFQGKTFLWKFPIEFLSVFSNVFIMTYLFEGSIMASYLRAHGITYELFSIGEDGEPAYYNQVDTRAIKERFRDLITLVEDDKLNSVGAKYHKAEPLSTSWYEREIVKGKPSKKVCAVAAALYNFFHNVARTPSDENMWSCNKKFQGMLADKGYTKGFVPMNARATNDYRHKSACAYAANRFVRKTLLRYFNDKDIPVRQDLFALCELLQWVWRSRIRDGQPIRLFVPSERMRRIFKAWLDNSDVEIVGGLRLDG